MYTQYSIYFKYFLEQIQLIITLTLHTTER